MIRGFLLILCCLSLVAPAAEPEPVCTPDGICRLPETPAEPGSAPAEKFILKRKLVGAADAAEILRFLRGRETSAAAGGFVFMLLAALAGGFLLNLTPCVLPLIPVNLAVIGAKGGANGFRRGLLYGAGMALTYGILGVLAAFAGVGFGSLNASPGFNFAVGFILLLMSLAMAGALNFDPARWFPRSGKLTEAGPLVMGALAALLAGACVAPAVVSVLLYTAREVAAGRYYAAVTPFVLGIGMALPWPLAGAGLKVLPRPGRFMLAVKYVFALAIFLAAAYYLFLGMKLLSSGRPGDGFAALEAARLQALEQGKPVLVRFTASWCKNCAALERGALTDPEVRKAMENEVVAVTFPAEDPEEPRIAALLRAWDIPGFPAFVLLEPVRERK